MSRIVSPNGPDVTITITLDTKTNATQLLSNKPVNKMIMAAVLIEHAKQLLGTLIMESAATPTNGGANAT